MRFRVQVRTQGGNWWHTCDRDEIVDRDSARSWALKILDRVNAAEVRRAGSLANCGELVDVEILEPETEPVPKQPKE